METRVLAGCFFCVVLCANVDAQVRLQPQPAPSVSATATAWYEAAEPLAIYGDYYFPTGPTVYFNGNTMVPTTTYGGVTLYADTTLEPFSVVFVPIGRGLMRPYERRRSGVLAGTVGSRTPSFPVQTASDLTPAATPQISPSAALPAPLRASTPTVGPVRGSVEVAPAAVGTSGVIAVAPSRATPNPPPEWTRMTTLARPTGTSGVWIEYDGARWRAAGRAEEFAGARYVRYGDYRSFPVYIRRGADSANPDAIYLPVGSGKVARYVRVEWKAQG